MNWFNTMLARVRAVFRKEKLDAQMDDEMRWHLAMQTQENIAAGMKPEEARCAARRQFGWVEIIKSTCRDQRGVGWLENLGQDIRYGARMLRKNPGFAVVAVLTLALGIGANTAIFSVVNAVLLRPLPYRDADRLITVGERNPEQGYDQNLAATGTFLDRQEQSRSFEGMAIFESNVGLTLTGLGEAERINGTRISAACFEVLGVRPLFGRTWGHEAEIARDAQSVILSHGLWQRRFGGDLQIVGKTLSLDGQSFQVIGVMPPKIKFPGMTTIVPFGGGGYNFGITVDGREKDELASRNPRLLSDHGRSPRARPRFHGTRPRTLAKSGARQ
jgi:hypothetical protein